MHNHEELFPGHVSRLSVSDPGLIEVFDNFAFDVMLASGDLDTRTRLMIQLATLTHICDMGKVVDVCEQ